MTSASTMDDQTATIGAQEIDHEAPKEEISSNLEEKISDVASADSPKHSIDRHSGSEKHDVEIAQEETIPPPIKVPRSKRRGLFGRFSILAEVEQPKHYPRKTKWFITFNIALAALAAPLGSAIIFRKPAFAH